MSALTELSRADRSLLESALGDDVITMLADELVSDILVRPWGVSIDTFDRGLVATGIVPRPGQIDGALRVISGLTNGKLSERNPILECKLPLAGGARVAGVMYGEGESFLTLRRHRALPVSLADYSHKEIACSKEVSGTEYREGRGVSAEVFSPVSVVRGLIAGRMPLLINGPTGSGKTTLLQACVHEAATQEPHAHYLFIEDTPELQCLAPHRTFMRTTPYLSMRDLSRAAMRHRPTWIIAGEVRGAEALDVVNAAITGHPVMATIHARSARGALNRMVAAIGEAVVNVDKERIVDAFGAVLSVRRKRVAGGRDAYHISEVVAIDDVTAGRWNVRSLLEDAN
jgi:type IV secretion system protein VirB11